MGRQPPALPRAGGQGLGSHRHLSTPQPGQHPRPETPDISWATLPRSCPCWNFTANGRGRGRHMHEAEPWKHSPARAPEAAEIGPGKTTNGRGAGSSSPCSTQRRARQELGGPRRRAAASQLHRATPALVAMPKTRMQTAPPSLGLPVAPPPHGACWQRMGRHVCPRAPCRGRGHQAQSPPLPSPWCYREPPGLLGSAGRAQGWGRGGGAGLSVHSCTQCLTGAGGPTSRPRPLPLGLLGRGFLVPPGCSFPSSRKPSAPPRAGLWCPHTRQPQITRLLSLIRTT